MREQRIWLLILNMTFNMVMGFILPVNTIFIHNTLHESLTTAGFALMIYSILMMIGNALGGIMFDRFSRRGTLYIGYFISVISLIIMSFYHVWPSYAFFLILLGFGMGLSFTAINAYTAFAAEQMVGDSRIIFNNMYLAANLGIAIGSTAVGFIFSASIFLTFFIPVLVFIICIIILFFKAHLFDMVNEDSEQEKEKKDYSEFEEIKDPRDLIGEKRFKINIVILCIAILIVWLGYSQWDSNMSIYMYNKGMSYHEYSFTFTINAASLLLIQPVMNRISSKLFKYLKTQLLFGIIIMGLSFLILPGAKHYISFVISMLIVTVGESMVFPTIPALLSKFSTNRNRGTFQSFYSMFGSLGRALGPYVGSLVVAFMSFGHMFYAITIMLILVAISMGGIKELE